MASLATFPWIDRDEFKCVYDELFSGNVDKKKLAVDRITAWKCRTMGRLPVAIESTYAFVIADIEYEQKLHEQNAELYLRNLYSLALIRFVNHITERGQQGPYARPVHIIASEFGVPEWIVVLRHEATHGALPSLNELRAAAKWALTWLKEKFWDLQGTDTFGMASLKSAAIEILEDSLVNFMQRRFEEIDSGNDSSKKQLIINMEQMFQQLGSCACSVLLQDGYLIFTKEQLTCLGVDCDVTESSSFLLPKKLVDFWKKVVKLLIRTDLLAELLLHMSTVISEAQSLRNSLLCSWMYTLIWHNRNLPKSDVFDQCIDLPYKMILQNCLDSCYARLDDLVTLLIECTNLNVECKQQLETVISSTKMPKLQLNEENIHTLASVQKDEDFRSWSKCTDLVDWSKLPFGTLPNVTATHTSLDLNRNIASEQNTRITQSVQTATNTDQEDNIETSQEDTEVSHRPHSCTWDMATMQKINDILHLF